MNTPYISPCTEVLRVHLQRMIALSTGDDDERGPQGAPVNPFGHEEEEPMAEWDMEDPDSWMNTKPQHEEEEVD